MKKFIDWLDKNHNKSLYELMTSQLYTAVLGSIIYMMFDWSYTVYDDGIYTMETFYRTAFLLIVVAFYLADLYYIKGSMPYRKWHFLFDIVFMVCMLYSIKLLKVDLKDMTELPKANLEKVKHSFIAFMSLYLIWDIREIIAIWTKDKKQRGYYYEVIVWEIISLCLLLILCNESTSRLLYILSFITLWFCCLSYRKSIHQPLHLWLKSIFSTNE